MPYDLSHPACLFKCLLYACRTIQEPWIYAQVNQDWSDVVKPTEIIGGLGARVWMTTTTTMTMRSSGSRHHQITATTLPRHSKMTEQTKIFSETSAAFQTMSDDTKSEIVQLLSLSRQNKNSREQIHRSSSSPSCSSSENEFDESRLHSDAHKKIFGTRNCTTSTSVTHIPAKLKEDPLHDVLVLHTDPFYPITTIKNSVSIFAKNISMNGFASLVSIRDNFQLYNWRVAEMDFSNLTRIKTIGDRFCEGAVNLKRITFNPALEVEHIGSNFLSCTSVEEIDLSFLSPNKFQTFSKNFLMKCTNLRVVKNISKVSKCLKKIESGFLQGAVVLEKIDFCAENDDAGENEFSLLSSFDCENFLQNCGSLKNLDLRFLPRHCTMLNLKAEMQQTSRSTTNSNTQQSNDETNNKNTTTIAIHHFISLTSLSGLQKIHPSKYHIVKVKTMKRSLSRTRGLQKMREDEVFLGGKQGNDDDDEYPGEISLLADSRGMFTTVKNRSFLDEDAGSCSSNKSNCVLQ